MIRMSKVTDAGIVSMVNPACASAVRTARQPAGEEVMVLSTVAKAPIDLSRHAALDPRCGDYPVGVLRQDIPTSRLSDAIEAYIGPITLTECNSAPHDSHHDRDDNCVVGASWFEINEVVRHASADSLSGDRARLQSSAWESRR